MLIKATGDSASKIILQCQKKYQQLQRILRNTAQSWVYPKTSYPNLPALPCLQSQKLNLGQRQIPELKPPKK